MAEENGVDFAVSAQVKAGEQEAAEARKRLKTLKKAERQRSIRQFMARGVGDRDTLATIFGVHPDTIENDFKEIAAAKIARVAEADSLVEIADTIAFLDMVEEAAMEEYNMADRGSSARGSWLKMAMDARRQKLQLLTESGFVERVPEELVDKRRTVYEIVFDHSFGEEGKGV